MNRTEVATKTNLLFSTRFNCGHILVSLLSAVIIAAGFKPPKPFRLFCPSFGHHYTPRYLYPSVAKIRQETTLTTLGLVGMDVKNLRREVVAVFSNIACEL